MKKTLRFGILLVSCFLLFLPVSADIIGDDIRQLEQVVKSFKVSEVSLSDNPVDIESKLLSQDFKLKKKSKNKNGTVRIFKKRVNKKTAVAKIMASQDDKTTTRIDLLYPAELHDKNFKGIKQQLDSTFNNFSRLCKWSKQRFICKALTDKDEIKIDVSFNNKNALRYILEISYSARASKIAERKKVEIERAKQLAEERRQKEIETARLRAEHQARLKEMARLKAEKEALFMKQVVRHPCNQYDRDSVEQASSCLKKLEADLANNEARKEVWQKGSEASCPKIQQNIEANLVTFGFPEAEANKRLPTCRVVAELYKQKFGDDVFWKRCINWPQQITAEFIYQCIDLDQNQRLACGRPMGSLFGHYVQSAGYKDKVFKTGFAALLDEACKMRMAKRSREEQARERQRLAAIQEREETIRQRLFDLYYKKTPEREKLLFSKNEHTMMQNGKITIARDYAAPGAEEIRRAVMRSMVERRIDYIGRPYYENGVKGTVGAPVVANDREIYFDIAGKGVKVRFDNPENTKCQERAGNNGYICEYQMRTVADIVKGQGGNNPISAAGNAGIKFLLSAANDTTYRDWFVLTRSGWMQPRTEAQKEELKNRLAESMQRQRERNSVDNNDSMIGQLISIGSDLAYARGAEIGREITHIRMYGVE